MEKLEYKHKAMEDAAAALVRSMQTYKRYYGHEDADLSETCVASVVKQFELFYETTWKYFKFYLAEKHAVETVGTRDIFRAMHDARLINSGQLDVFLDCIKIRNATVHTYDKDFAQALCAEIIKIYPDIKIIIDGVVAR